MKRLCLAFVLAALLAASSGAAQNGPAGFGDLSRPISSVKPAVKPYTIAPDLSNIVNIRQFGKLGKPERELIAKNAFVVVPSDYIQLYHVYENNAYPNPKIPSFITVDSMLQTYHIFYDYTLRKVETDKLYAACRDLTAAMLKASKADYAAAKSPKLKDAAKRNVAYFAVAKSLLDNKPTAPPYAAKIVNADLAKIKAHARRDLCETTGFKLDFTQFVPRGHYTRSETLKRYFLAMMWYGLVQFPLPDEQFNEEATRRALLVVKNLRTARAKSVPAMQVWDRIYGPTVFYVGSADDYTAYQYTKIADRVYGSTLKLTNFADDKKLHAFIAGAKKLPPPRIENFIFEENFPTGPQFRFMGQRFIPDSRILQELTHPKVYERYFPKGLDVFAAMGSGRAYQILDKDLGETRFSDYSPQMAEMRKEMAGTSLSTWQSNLYYGWLWVLYPVTEVFGEGYPIFMRNEAWLDKSLNTALASWTELRHDTILYAKQSVSECGDGEREREKPKGYVEPNVEFWSRLEWLTKKSREGLQKRNLITGEIADRFTKMEDLLNFLKRVSIKELTGQRVTEDEYDQIQIYGAALEELMLNFAGGDIISEADKDMALVADVHTSGDKCLEEAVGHAGVIYVAVPIEGKIRLTRGAVFTHYEFVHPSSDRLTDEKWQRMLKEGQAPPVADWTRSFMPKVPTMKPGELASMTGGC